MPSLHGPVAVVAGGCRFPGAPDLEAFRTLLRDGRQATGPMPAWRWASATTRIAGVIDAPDEFDAGFFGIAPREADQMDPQQRLLLEVAWEALEAAGQTRATLAGSRSGVYVGLSSVDYARIRPDDPALLDAYAATGNAPSVAANRLSYILDLHGPSMAVDTACSSSLVAVHLACRALAVGEIDLALAGGVNLLLASDLMTVFTAARMLAPDGRCKTFDAAADGYVRGEGCGVVVLKRLADAQAAGDPVLAVIRGSATNQDGRSNGLTAPNGQAQRAVIQAALADAGLTGEAIDAVELHGTGTRLGDPIEAQALAAALDTAQRPAPCPVGSVKTNIGHLEAAAGIAGLLKAVLAARDRMLPASLNFTTANPDIGLDALGLAVAATPAALPADRPVRLGISSFGFGGSNAHVIVESPPELAPAPTPTSAGPFLLPISAHTAEALRQRAAAFVTRLRGCGRAQLADLVFTASVRRTHLDHRLAVIGADAEALAARLARYLDGAADSGIMSGRRPPGGARTMPTQTPTLAELAALFAAGDDPDWRRIAPQGCVIDLPALPWQRRRHWYPAAVAPATQTPTPTGQIAYRLDWQRVPGSVSGSIAARLDDICAAYVRAALRAEPEVVPGRREVVARLRERLANHAPRHDAPDDPAAALHALIASAPDLASELSLLARTGGALAAVLDGTVDPLSLLFPAGDMAALRLPYADAPAARQANRMIAAAAVREAGRRGGAVRVLEIGGGTGATTDAVLAALDTAGNYVFTDVSAHFCAAASAAYAKRGVTCRTLDIEQAPAAQGFAPAEFDLVIAANVLHATRSIAETLAHIRALLAPGGTLLLLETVRASWPLELTFGLTDGWWRFADHDLRAEQPLLDIPSWRAALARAGFATSHALPCESQGRQAVLVADGHAPTWHICGGTEADRAALGGAMDAHGIAAGADAAGCDAIVDLGAPAGSAAQRCAWSLDVLRAASLGSAPVWTVTQRAQPAGDTVPVAEAAALWGLGRTAAIERPRLWAGLIDLDGPLDGAAAASLLAAIGSGGGDAAAETALRDGAWLSPVLVPDDHEVATLSLDPAHRYLVTGGLGALGLEMAEWLIGRGARDVVLAGRTPPDATRCGRITALQALGASVSSVVLDMTRPTDVADCVRGLGINGVVHAAGVHDDGLLTDLDAARLDHVLGAKLDGALALDAAMQGPDIDLFLLVSSAAALTGLPGAGSYTAANAALDALAASRRRRGLLGLSVGFAPLDGLGMATQVSERPRQRWKALGIRPLAAEAALARLATAPPDGPAHLLLLHFDPTAKGPLARRLPRPAEGAPMPHKLLAEGPRLARLVTASFPAERPAVLAAEVAALAADILKLPDGVSPDPERGLQDQGLDSLMALELHGRLQSLTGLRLPTTLALERPTVQTLAAHLLAALDAQVPAPAVVPARVPAVFEPASGGLAAIVARIAALTDAASLAALAEPPA